MAVTRLVFGEADPKDYMAPLCARCGHMRSEHFTDDWHKAQPCWHGWDDDGDEEDEDCDCMDWVARDATS